jgi:transketolase
MRSHFLGHLRELATQHPEIMFLTGDLGFGVVESFQRDLPQQFLNLGAAEQNMIGVATGLASRGFIPFTYSIINFSVLRPLEFIRNGPIAHGFPVRIVGVGPGFEYGTNGPTHYGVEDIACLRAIGGLDIIVPGDVRRAEILLGENWNVPGPLYFRLSKDDRLVFPELSDAELRNGFLVLDPTEGGQRSDRSIPETAIVCLGSAIGDGLKARRLLRRNGIEVDLVCVERINDESISDLAAHLSSYANVVTVEAHSIRGGLGSAVAEKLGDLGSSTRIRRLGIAKMPTVIGNQSTLDQLCGFDAEGIATTVEGLSALAAV